MTKAEKVRFITEALRQGQIKVDLYTSDPGEGRVLTANAYARAWHSGLYDTAVTTGPIHGMTAESLYMASTSTVALEEMFSDLYRLGYPKTAEALAKEIAPIENPCPDCGGPTVLLLVNRVCAGKCDGA